MNILNELRRRFARALDAFTDEPQTYAAMVRPAQDKRFGDFQANCAMPLAKQRKTNPRELAAEIVSRLDVADLCAEPEIAGPGFINLTLRDDWIEAEANRLVGDDRLGVEAAGMPRTIVVDFSGPNLAKPMHVGHLRSTVIGDALRRMLRFAGHRVTGDNHIGDWGTQFGMILYGYKHFLDEQAYRTDPVAELARLYRMVNQLCDDHELTAELPRLRQRLVERERNLSDSEANADPKDKQAGKSLKKLRSEIAELREEIKSLEKKREAVETSPALRELAQVHPNIVAESRQEIAKLHAGDEQNQRLWTEFMPACRAALDRVYDRLGVTFEETLGESFYQPMLADVVADLKQKNLAVESAGAVCVFIERNEAPFIVQKSDGAFTYATTDLATIRYRAEEFGADAILYVVDARQSEHFQLLFAAARKWGHDGIEYRHVSFGTVLGPDGKPYRTRAGDTVGLESLLDEAVARAARVVAEVDEKKKDGPELGERERAAIAEIVGMGAVKYADLHHNRESDYKFDWDKMLALTGDTAAYVQYSVARIHGIFRKGAIDRESLPESGAAIRFTEPEERALALQLLRFPEALDAAIAEYRPNLLTQYLFETANVFTAFYEKCSVLNADDEATRDSRLLLCDLYGRVLTQGLELLGIGAPQRM